MKELHLLTHELVGERCLLTYINNNKAITIDCAIGYQDGLFYLCHDSHPLDAGGKLKNQYGFKYIFGLNSPTLSPALLGGWFVGLKLKSSKILKKTSANGHIFRKIYKEDGDIVFLGSVQKDPEECNKPSAVISPMDLKYMLSKGWNYHVEDLSAEKRATISVK